jgi:peptidoglycan-associated lipoprotein
MNLASRSIYRTGFFVLLSAAVFTFGCKKTAKAPPPPPPPAPAPARPTVTLQANPTSVNKGESSTLSWNSTDATQLSIDPGVGAVTAQGSTKVTPTDSTTYTITATGPGGSASATAAVSVNAPPPPPAPAPAPEPDFNAEVHDAYFDTDKANIRPDARDAISKSADFLKAHPSIKVNIEGHCDERGSTEYNLGLGDRRASAVKQYLVSLGVSADRITTVSFGKEKPVCMEHNETCWQQNRRGHFVKAN